MQDLMTTMTRALRTRTLAFGAIAMIAGQGGCASAHDDASSVPDIAHPLRLACDDSIGAVFRPDRQTTVLLVKSFKAGEPLILSGPATPQTPLAASDLCMVKLRVGPGNPGPADAPSTSPGIGIEIWLPAPDRWNHRVHVTGGGGWAGGVEGSTSLLAGAALSNPAVLNPALIAGVEAAVSASTDAGHANVVNGGSFAMTPDGRINTALWRDFASRAIHEMAVKTKLLAALYYGALPRYSYWDGFSTGGRQALMEAQANPADFDGILAGAPANNFTRMVTAGLYPWMVFERDLGGTPLTIAQQDLVSSAAIAACDVVGGQHLGYLLDPSTCTYDPTMDASVLCTSSGGNNVTSACVTTTQAQALNKIWYGMTADGSVPAPAVDNGWRAATAPRLPDGVQRWFGLNRGTSLYLAGFGGIGLTGVNGPFPIGTDLVALELQDSTLAGPSFINASGNGAGRWSALSYTQLSNAFDRGIALQDSFAQINTDNPDLRAFQARNGKLIQYHGLSDELIFPQGSVNYYNRVANQMGGLLAVQPFYRLFMIPGFGHGTPNGTANPAANNPAPAAGQLYALLTSWVENGIAPDGVVLQSPSSTPVSRTLPLCAYPGKATYVTGDPNVAASYRCR